MEFVLMLILFIIFYNSSSKSTGSSRVYYDEEDSNGVRGVLFSKKDASDSFDPADTFYFEDGLEHEIDDDGYCEECDDYHD